MSNKYLSKIEYPFSLEELRITLRRGMCYGPCPVYELTVLGTGEVIYNGEHFVKIVGEQRGNISKASVLKLLSYAEEIGFLKMYSRYESESSYYVDDNGQVQENKMICTDLPSYEVEIQIGDKKKRVYDYLGAPKRLRRFENMIDRVCNSKQWIGVDEL